MAKNFWLKLNKPFFALAPLANVTDPAFRRIIAKYSKPDGPNIFWTEFVSADGLFMGGRDALIKDLFYTEEERPIVAQFFTSKPEMMEKASALALELGFDGVDINMGCPDKSVEKQGAGAVLCKNPTLACDLIKSAKKGCQEKIPVSVKIRLGYNKDELGSASSGWLHSLLKENPAAVTIHARTRKEMSKVPAHWDRIEEAVKIRDEMKSATLILGNGDALDLEDAKEKASKYKCDGVMLGRAIFGRPYLFSSEFSKYQNKENPEVIEKILKILVEHCELFEKLLPHKNFNIMKKHFKAYVSGWSYYKNKEGAKELRIKLMGASNTSEVEKIIKEYLS